MKTFIYKHYDTIMNVYLISALISALMYDYNPHWILIGIGAGALSIGTYFINLKEI